MYTFSLFLRQSVNIVYRLAWSAFNRNFHCDDYDCKWFHGRNGYKSQYCYGLGGPSAIVRRNDDLFILCQSNGHWVRFALLRKSHVAKYGNCYVIREIGNCEWAMCIRFACSGSLSHFTPNWLLILHTNYKHNRFIWSFASGFRDGTQKTCIKRGKCWNEERKKRKIWIFSSFDLPGNAVDSKNGRMEIARTNYLLFFFSFLSFIRGQNVHEWRRVQREITAKCLNPIWIIVSKWNGRLAFRTYAFAVCFGS